MEMNQIFAENLNKGEILSEYLVKAEAYKNSIQKFEGDMVSFKNFTKNRRELKTRQISLPGYKNTMCKACSSLCHEHCGLAETNGQVGHPELKSCACMSGDCCNVCKHSYSYHYHHSSIEVKTESYYEDFVDIDFQTKANYDNAKTAKEAKFTELKKVETEVEEKQKELEKIYEKLALVNKEIKRMSLQPHNDAYLDYLKVELKKLKDSDCDPNEKANLMKMLEKKEKDYILKKKMIEEAEKANKN